VNAMCWKCAHVLVLGMENFKNKNKYEIREGEIVEEQSMMTRVYDVSRADITKYHITPH
jgi:ethanolamine utilization cobalamin adenosyltransferase